jgi:hypothetical protein
MNPFQKLTFDVNVTGNAGSKFGGMANAANRIGGDDLGTERLKKGRGGPCCPCCEQGVGGKKDDEKKKGESAFAAMRKRALVAFAIAEKVLTTSTALANAAGNDSLSNAQKARAFGAALIPGFKAMVSFAEAIDGTTEALRKSALAYEVNLKSVEAVAHAFTQMSQADTRRFGYEGQRRAANQFFVPQNFFDKRTVGGEQASEDEEKRYEAREALARATMDARAKQFQEESSKGLVNQSVGRAEAAQKRMINLKKEEEDLRRAEERGLRLKSDINENLNQQDLTNREIIASKKQYQEEILRMEQMGISTAQAEATVREKVIQQHKTELDILKAKEQRMAEGQRRLGLMNKGQYELAKQMALNVKRIGVENATPEMIELARTVAPRMIDKMGENFGAERARELSNKGIDDFAIDYGQGETLETIRKQINEIKAQVNVEIRLNEQILAAEIVKKTDQTFARFFESVTGLIKDELNQIRIGQRMRQNQEN